MVVYLRMVAVIMLGVFCCAVAIAEPDKGSHAAPVLLQLDEVGDFASLLSAARRKGGVSLLVEDAPLHLRLAAGAQKTLATKLAKQVSLVAQMELVADLYDFDVIPVAGDFYIWRKRFTDSDDIPNVTYEEVRESIHRLYALFQSFAPAGVPEPDSFMYSEQQRALPKLFSLAQVEQAGSENGLPVRTLLPGQKEQLWAAMLDVSTANMRMFLSGANHGELMVQRGVIQFGYAGLDGQKPEGKHVASFFPYRDSAATGKRFLSRAQDSIPDLKEEAVRARLTSFTRTLPAFLEPMSLLPPGNGVGQKPLERTWFQTEPILAKRSLLFAGAPPATHGEAAQWVSGMCAAFGWETKTTRDLSRAGIGQNVIEVRRIPAKPLRNRRDFADLSSAVGPLVPEPVRRFLLLNDERRLTQELDQFNNQEYVPVLRTSRNVSEAQIEFKKLMEEHQSLVLDTATKLNKVRERGRIVTINGATRRFRDMLYARLRKVANPAAPEKVRIPATALTDREKSLFALGELIPALSAMRGWLLETPPYIGRFDELSLVYRPSQEEDGRHQMRLGTGKHYETFLVY